MIRSYLNRLIFWLFGKKKDCLIFARQYIYELSYSTKETWLYLTFNQAKKRVIKNKQCYFLIESKYNGLHYPVIDIDNGAGLPELLNRIGQYNLGYIVIQSSIGHYWVIIDYGKKHFCDSFEIIQKLGGCGADEKYYKMSLMLEKYHIRACYNPAEITRLPIVLFGYSASRPNTPHVRSVTSTETGAWKSSYHQKYTIKSTQFSDNFSKYINKLNKYYCVECHELCRIINFNN